MAEEWWRETIERWSAALPCFSENTVLHNIPIEEAINILAHHHPRILKMSLPI